MEDTTMKGIFIESLKRTSSQIRDERAEIIGEDAETAYRHHIEELRRKLRRLQNQRRVSLDMSPDDVNTIISGRDFNAEAWVDKDISAGMGIRKLKIQIEVAEERYDILFGNTEVKAAEATV